MASKLEMKQRNTAIRMGNNVKYFAILDDDSHIHVQDGNGKIGKILNISTLPGRKLLTRKDGLVYTNVVGTCGGCCEHCEKDCYAVNYCGYHNNTCIPAYAENTLLLREKPDQYFAELEKVLKANKGAYLRIHVSGEFESKNHMKGHMDLGIKTPDNIQYFYTKRYKWLEDLDNAREIPNNVRPTVSIWHNNYSNPNKFHEFIYDDGIDPEVEKLPHCPAVDKKGKSTGVTCDKCGRCIRAERGTKTAVYAH